MLSLALLEGKEISISRAGISLLPRTGRGRNRCAPEKAVVQDSGWEILSGGLPLLCSRTHQVLALKLDLRLPGLALAPTLPEGAIIRAILVN